METEQMTRYETMYEYVVDADVSHYRHSNADENAPEMLIVAFLPYADADFCVDWGDTYTHNGTIYIRVCWGEPEKSYLREDAIYDVCYLRCTREMTNDGSDYGEYVSDGHVYETKEMVA